MIIKEVEDSETNDFTVSDVTEEEQEYLFKKGLQALVNEARKGKTQFIVVDPEHPAAPEEGTNKLSVEIDDDDVDALIQVGITQILIDFIEKEKEEEGYWKNLKKAAEEAGEKWDDGRMDIIGQNGNDGLHYVENDDGTKVKVQHKMKDYEPEFGKLRDGVKEP